MKTSPPTKSSPDGVRPGPSPISCSASFRTDSKSPLRRWGRSPLISSTPAAVSGEMAVWRSGEVSAPSSFIRKGSDNPRSSPSWRSIAARSRSPHRERNFSKDMMFTGARGPLLQRCASAIGSETPLLNQSFVPSTQVRRPTWRFERSRSVRNDLGCGCWSSRHAARMSPSSVAIYAALSPTEITSPENPGVLRYRPALMPIRLTVGRGANRDLDGLSGEVFVVDMIPG